MGEIVRSTVEETLNQMLDAEADKMCNADKYQRTEAREDTRAGHYRRKLHTKSGWSSFLQYLKKRGLKGVRLFTMDCCMGLVESLAEYFPKVRWQRCMVHFYRNVFGIVPRNKMASVAAMLKAIHASEDLEAALEKSKAVCRKLQDMKLPKAAKKIEKNY